MVITQLWRHHSRRLVEQGQGFPPHNPRLSEAFQGFPQRHPEHRPVTVCLKSGLWGNFLGT